MYCSWLRTCFSNLDLFKPSFMIDHLILHQDGSNFVEGVNYLLSLWAT